MLAADAEAVNWPHIWSGTVVSRDRSSVLSDCICALFWRSHHRPRIGHYFAARWCGVKVLRFSIGFGPVLWQKKMGRDATEWAVAPSAGGYVKMLDEREAEVPSAELHRAFNRQGVGKRSLIVAAGPLANFCLGHPVVLGCLHLRNERTVARIGYAARRVAGRCRSDQEWRTGAPSRWHGRFDLG